MHGGTTDHDPVSEPEYEVLLPAEWRPKHVYVVHSVRDAGHGAIEYVETERQRAEQFARGRSGDPGTAAAVVTQLEVGKLGTRRIVAWYVAGRRRYFADRSPLPKFEPSREPPPELRPAR